MRKFKFTMVDEVVAAEVKGLETLSKAMEGLVKIGLEAEVEAMAGT